MWRAEESLARWVTLTKSQQRALANQFPHRWNREYCYWKLRTDPLYPAVCRELLAVDDQRTPLLDIGCGMGLFACYLKAAGFRAPVRGIDYDARKIEAARRRSRGTDPETSDLTFVQGDAREALPEFLGHVSILDVLQFLTPQEQRLLLEKAIQSLGTRGVLVIRSGLAEPGWRFPLTRLADAFAHACFLMKGRPVSYPARSELEGWLREAGLDGGFRPLWGKTPFNNYLGVFRRTGTASAG